MHSVPTPSPWRKKETEDKMPSFSPNRPPASYLDRKSTRLNSSHANISYAVFCLEQKRKRPKSGQANISHADVFLTRQRPFDRLTDLDHPRTTIETPARRIGSPATDVPPPPSAED